MKLVYSFIVTAFLFTGLSACCNDDSLNSKTEISVIQSDSLGRDSSGIVAAYRCPMKCEGDKSYTSPGQCPECKMDLKEVK